MNKIETLIKELCPNGVELEEIGKIIDYEQPTKYLVSSKEYNDNYELPVLTAGQTFILGYTNETEGIYQASKENPVIIFDDFTTSKKWVDFNFKVKSTAMKILKVKSGVSNILIRYVWHYLGTITYSPDQHGRQWISTYSKFKIPIPPLEVQEEIVKILDKFTDYVTELTTELTLRQKQYHYYRDKLLSLENEEFESKKLGEVCNFIRGNGLQKKDFVEKGFPVIHYGQIYTKYGFSARDTISFANGEIYNKLRKAKRGDIIMATTSENIEDLGKSVVWEGEQEVGISGDSYIIQTSQNPRFINYYLQSIHFQLQKEKKVTGTKVIRINSKDMVNFDIKVPSLLRQKQIVSILDNFDVLTSNLVFGLPKEIELRKKQYEYYRDKLLSFD